MSKETILNLKGDIAKLQVNFKISYGEDDLYLDSKYIAFYNKAQAFLGERIFKDYLRRFAYGLDASCYRYIPKLVIWVKSEKEIQKILKLSSKYEIPLTFRAAGTSLCGQACSESVLVVASRFWKNISLTFDRQNIPTSIWCDCGVIGADANKALKPYGKKIGPDPATINNALIGGIFSNNSSGMCCGVKQNSYQTIQSIRVILHDGFILDTSDSSIMDTFYKQYSHITQGLLNLRAEILADNDLKNLITKKFAIKNTTGYALNALVDFSEIKDILNHIFIGAEGTLGFVSRVEYECVKDFNHKACALLFYENLSIASHAIKILAKNDFIVSAAEIMDYACLVSAKSLEGMPKEIELIQEGNCAILVQLEEDDRESLQNNIAIIQNELASIQSLFGNEFSFDSKTQESWWKIRKGLLPLSASMRPSGSTVITEDVCFEIEHFTQGIEGISKLFDKYHFKGIIFGHALSGNVHFIITPLLSDKEELTRFGAFMEDLARFVASFQGSIKAEHGTGRMVAPFVEIEWGEKAYRINQQIKAIFDSKNLINPDVMLSNDKEIHLKNLKPAGSNLIEDYLDACMECGFCEKICPSKNLSLTPRQRIAVYREIKRLESKKCNSLEKQELDSLKQGYQYFGVETCATCSMCATLCPLEIDTATIALKYASKESGFSHIFAKSFAGNIARTTKLMQYSVSVANATQNLFGAKLAKQLTLKANAIFKTPVLLEYFPSKNLASPNLNQAMDSNQKLDSKNTSSLQDSKTPQTTQDRDFSHSPKITSNQESSLYNDSANLDSVVYFSSCLNRSFAPSKKAADLRPISEVFASLCKKADVKILTPHNLANLCCGKAYKNHKAISEKLANKAYHALLESSNNGALPIVCDHSACSLELLKSVKHLSLQENAIPLEILDMPAFVQKFLAPKLTFQVRHEKIALYAPCSTRNLLTKNEGTNWEEAIFTLAKSCGVTIVQDENLKCCGFAGNKGFFTPELNESSLESFGVNPANKQNIFSDITQGFSSSSTCEIGLSDRSGFAWQHIIYLVDSCTQSRF